MRKNKEKGGGEEEETLVEKKNQDTYHRQSLEFKDQRAMKNADPELFLINFCHLLDR